MCAKFVAIFPFFIYMARLVEDAKKTKIIMNVKNDLPR